jgi:DNA replication protein DnaC
MTPSLKTQALEALIEAHATELKLPTVKRRFRQMAAEATREQQTPVAYLAALLEAEMAERAERREKRRLIDARFPIIKRLEEFRFADNPEVPQATIAGLADGSWLDDRESVIFVGESGTGKTCSPPAWRSRDSRDTGCPSETELARLSTKAPRSGRPKTPAAAARHG